MYFEFWLKCVVKFNDAAIQFTKTKMEKKQQMVQTPSIKTLYRCLGCASELYTIFFNGLTSSLIL